MVYHIGAESFMTSMLYRLELDISMTMSALNCLKLDPNLRKKIAESLVPSSKMKVCVFYLFVIMALNLFLKDMLYIILIANNRVVTLIRPRKHSIHPAGMLLNSILILPNQLKL